MQDKFKEAVLRFEKLFVQREASLNGQRTHPWHLLKREAMDTAVRLGFPGRKNENWKYTPVQRLLDTDFSMTPNLTIVSEALKNHPLCNLDTIPLVFINGQFNSELSGIESLDERIRIIDLKSLDHADAEMDVIKASYSRWITEEDTSFLPLNLALSGSAFMISVPDGYTMETPLHLMHFNIYDENPVITNPLVFVQAGKHSKIRILESVVAGRSGNVTTDYPHFSNSAIYFNISPGAHAEHFKLQQGGLDHAIINNTRVIQAQDSHYRNYSVDLGGRLVRNNLYVKHLSTGITSDLYGIYIAGGNQHIDNQSFIDHAHPHCQSNELYKGIVSGSARAVFNGKIIVRKDAQKTNAFQQNANLLLSEKGVVDSKPQLEIFADDVRCSHGGTIGQLDENALYYLKTRGLKDDSARALLQHAFVREVLDLYQWDALRDRIDRLISGKFVQQRFEKAVSA